jgi:hypothetical protein
MIVFFKIHVFGSSVLEIKIIVMIDIYCDCNESFFKHILI